MVYLIEIINRMVSNTNYVLSEWDGFRSNFISSVENTATSSANKMTNDFIYYYEKGFRSNKFGIPVGIFSAGNIYPEKVEAFYNRDVSGLLGKLQGLMSLSKVMTYLWKKTLF